MNITTLRNKLLVQKHIGVTQNCLKPTVVSHLIFILASTIYSSLPKQTNNYFYKKDTEIN